MKQGFFIVLFCITAIAQAQDTTKLVEPGYETSFENTELWLIALLGLLLLIAVYFLFRRRKTKAGS